MWGGADQNVTWQEFHTKQITSQHDSSSHNNLYLVLSPETSGLWPQILSTSTRHHSSSNHLRPPLDGRRWDLSAPNQRKRAGKLYMDENVTGTTNNSGHTGGRVDRWGRARWLRTVTADTKITFLSSSQQRNTQSFNHALKHTNDFVRKLVACRCLRMVFNETTSLSKRNGRSAHSGKSDEARGGVVQLRSVKRLSWVRTKRYVHIVH